MKKLLNSFICAGRGLFLALRSERNMRIHLVAVVSVLLFARFFNFNATQYILLFLTFAAVIAAELFNTALEYLCDRVESEYSPLIRDVKDMSGGAVLVIAIAAVCVAVCLFAQPDKLRRIPEFFAGNPLAIAAAVVYVIAAWLFIFKIKFVKK